MERQQPAARLGDRAGAAERIRVVTLVDKLSLLGGAEHLALMTATRLDPARFESVFCVSRWPPPENEIALDAHHAGLARLEETGTRLLPLGRRRKLELAPWRRLARFLRRERVDVLHAHKFGSNVWGTLVGSAARVPVLLAHEHTWSYEGNPVRRILDRELIARRADRFIAVSREDRRRMTDVEGISPERTIFIPNGIPPSAPPSGADVRAELGIEKDTQVIGTIGVLRAQKAHHVLLRAVAQLARDYPSLTVLIAGEGPERGPLEALAHELGIAPQVRLLGFREDVSDVLSALDVAVSSSDFEGSPLAVLEYMEAARPVVATAVGGVPDLIDDGVHGLLVPPGDSSALARAIGELLADPQCAQRLAARAQARRRSEFDIETHVRRLEDLYEELLEQNRTTRARDGSARNGR
jgi:glycosyltransferase involved in cell wall biosynthesis